MILGSHEGILLKKKPLKPTIFPISQHREDIFRQLARISRSTRGVVILLCDLMTARRILHEAQRLQMVGGHFIWIWADASSNTEFYDQTVQSEEKTFDGLDFISLLNRNNARENGGASGGGVGGGGGSKQHEDEIDDMRKFSSSSDASEETFNSGQEIDGTNYYANNFNPHQTEHINPLLKVPDSNENIMMMKRMEGGATNGATTLNRTKRGMNYPIMTDTKTDPERNFDFEITDARLNSRHFNASAADVMFHNFKEFPVGLLALRPIKMAVEGKFIRASIRLFAKTWIKLEGNYDFLLQYQTKTKRNVNMTTTTTNDKINNNRTTNSGLNNTETNTSKSNTSDHNYNKTQQQKVYQHQVISDSSRTLTKRIDPWWSMRPDSARSRAGTSLTNNPYADFATPQYKGGCFGYPTQSDINRAELFAR